MFQVVEDGAAVEAPISCLLPLSVRMYVTAMVPCGTATASLIAAGAWKLAPLSGLVTWSICFSAARAAVVSR